MIAMRRRRFAAGLALAPLLGACGRRAAVRIGFLGDFAGSAGEFTADAHNGVVLGIEDHHAAGGQQRPFELLSQDYSGGPQRQDAAIGALLDAGVDVLIGPYSSPTATRMLPQAEARRVPMIGPIITGEALVGQDDYLIRLNVTSQSGAHATARMLRAAGWMRLALACDLRNAYYTVPWAQAFRAAFEAAGGAVPLQVDFGQGGELEVEDTVAQLLAVQPAGLVFVASSVDTARLAQQVAKRSPGMPLAAAGWADNLDLIELGGRAVEGMLLAQPYNRADRSPRFLAFHAAYSLRFEREPSYAAIASFDAVQVLSQALARAAADEPLRDALLRHAPYQGLQVQIGLDRFGDAERPSYFTVVREGRFVLAS